MSRVLLVDDDLDLLESLSVILADHFEVVPARNGMEAWRHLELQSFQALVLDLTMPFIDGETLIEKMREAGVVVPTILASGVSDLHARAERLGVDYIVKPYDLSALIRKLEQLTRASADR